MKRSAKLAISLLLRAWDILHDAFFRLIGKPLPPRCMVLYYHAIPAQSRALFASQLDTILKVARPVPTNPKGDLCAGTRYVSVTFDDGFISVLQNAAPELEARQIPWTIFIPSGRLGQKPDWLKHAHPAAREDRVMTADELRKLARDPLVNVASHTVTHANLPDLDSHAAFEELSRSKARLEEIVGRPVNQFSYPFGARTPALDQQARAAGYMHIFCSKPDFVPLSTLSFQPSNIPIGRASVDPDMSPLEFRLKILGAYRWLGRRDHKTTDH